jgi:hypothetical protein
MIISTETSGGGLPRFGVFPNQQIYTVYLDMRRTNGDPAPSWIFEYAVLPGTSVQPNAASPPAPAQDRFVLPFPVMKEQPALPADVVRRHLRQLVVVYGIINIDGKIEQMSVKQSPDAVLNEGVLAALAKWVFRPAQLDGETVPVKVLLGIPLALQE